MKIEIRKDRQEKKRPWRGEPWGRWITARKLTQYVTLLAFLLLFLMSKPGGWTPSLVNLPLRLDPLLMLTLLLSSRVFLVSSAIALVILLITLVFGRAWCGWLC